MGIVFLLALGILVSADVNARDTSRRSVSIHPSRFHLVETIPIGPVSFLGPQGRHAIRYRANDVLLFPMQKKSVEQVLSGHIRNVHDAGWSKNGRIVATTGYDGLVKVWNVSTGKQVSSFRAHTGFS